jgi:hypothetical protein
MLRKIVLPCLLIACAINISAQSYRNEWIDYTKTYYKFKIGTFGTNAVGDPIKNGVVRIYQPALTSAGLGSISAEQFQLWHNGLEVPLYISKTTGILGVADFIEFWGEMANGKLDKDLYPDSTYQLSDSWCLASDSSAYFLTVNTAGSNLRLVTTANNVGNAGIPAEKNFVYTVGRYDRRDLNAGLSVFDQLSGVYLSLSSFEIGEGYSGHDVTPSSPVLQSFAPLYAETAGNTVTLRVNMVGNAFYERKVKMFLNGDSVGQVSMSNFLSSKTVIANISASKLVNDSANVRIQDIAPGSDKIRVAQIEVSYRRKFNFGNAARFEFDVNASAADGRYLKIVNFNGGTGAPVLYDLTNNKRYIANTDVADTLRFLLLPSSKAYHLVLVRADGTTAKSVSSLEAKSYINYSRTVNQGNYLIISNPRIYGSGGTDYVKQYQQYRNSVAGGNYNAKLISISDLEDQFAYGIKMHPLAIKNFLRFARNRFQTPPLYVFLIGKGVSYWQYLLDFQNPFLDQINLVPTFGNPGSDNLLSSDLYSDVPATPIGRLSAVSPQEVGIYLSKVKEYETAQANQSDSIENQSWHKNVLQVTGGNDDAQLGTLLDGFMRDYENIIGDTLFGANVINYSDNANPKGYAEALLDFTNKYNAGSAMVSYFGHSSNTSLDFDLDDPNKYSNAGRYPFFLVNGCVAGNIFDYDTYHTRFSQLSSLSEKFMLAPSRGSIAFLSTSSFGVVNYLDVFTNAFYKAISLFEYNNGIGDVVKTGSANALAHTGYTDFYGRMHAQQYILHGDPAIRMSKFSLPDYAIQANSIHVESDFISTADDSIVVNINIYNLGKAISDSVHFAVFRYKNNSDSSIVYSAVLPYIKAVDTLQLKLPIVPNKDTGTIKYAAYIDDKHQRAELSENNNLAYFNVTVSSKEIRPIYPYNYAIISLRNVSLAASTADPLSARKKYLLELDSTSLFNSPLKIEASIFSKGGLVQFNTIKLPLNNLVYYWRVAPAGNNPHWNNFSFVYKNDSLPGFEQAHFYQHTQSAFDGLKFDTASRLLQFAPMPASVFAKQAVYPYTDQDNDLSVSVNGSFIGLSACIGHSVLFNVLDPKTFKVWANATHPFGAAGGCKNLTQNNFEFSTQSSSARKNAMDFLDSYVPNGFYVVVRKIYDLGDADWAPTVWAKDTALYGHNNSLYHRFKDQGLSIDSFIFPRTFIFIYKKNDSGNYTPVSVFSKGVYDKITASSIVSVFDTAGTVNSPRFGPAKTWNTMRWKGNNINTNNSTSVDIIGIDNNGNDSVFYTLNKSQTQRNISNINAKNYPYVQLRMHTQDTTTDIPFQLTDWMVSYVPVPEGAIAPNLGINIPDTIIYNHAANTQYDTLKGYVVFKNISKAKFLKLKINLSLTNNNGVVYNFNVPRTRTLPPGDTLWVTYSVNATALVQGKYNLRLEVNPGNDQPEQYHFNNVLYKFIYIKRKGGAPVLDAAYENNSAASSKFSVFPNPFKDQIKITSSSGEHASVKLISITGQVLLQRSFTGNMILRVPGLSAGSYLIEITSALHKEIFKLQKD